MEYKFYTISKIFQLEFLTQATTKWRSTIKEINLIKARLDQLETFIMHQAYSINPDNVNQLADKMRALSGQSPQDASPDEKFQLLAAHCLLKNLEKVLNSAPPDNHG